MMEPRLFLSLPSGQPAPVSVSESYFNDILSRFVPTSQSVMSVDAERLEDGAVQGVMSKHSVNIMIK